MLAQTVSDLPPEDIVAEVTPWKKSMHRVLIGLAMSSLTLNFWCLNYILPAIGFILMLLGFRTLRRENTPFKACYAITLIRSVYYFPMLILNATIYQQTFYESLYFVRSVYISLFRLVTGQSGFNEMSGPVGIASVIGEAAEIGFAESFMAGFNNILYIMALIAFNLGIINLLPLPALDGGRLIFLIIEGIRRKPVNPKYEGIVHFIGLLLFFALMIAITFNDVSRLITGCITKS